MRCVLALRIQKYTLLFSSHLFYVERVIPEFQEFVKKYIISAGPHEKPLFFMVELPVFPIITMKCPESLLWISSWRVFSIYNNPSIFPMNMAFTWVFVLDNHDFFTILLIDAVWNGRTHVRYEMVIPGSIEINTAHFRKPSSKMESSSQSTNYHIFNVVEFQPQTPV